MKRKSERFIDSGIINCEYSGKADHVILALNYDITSSGLKGADKGPEAIINALRRQIEPYHPDLSCEPCERAKIACVWPTQDLNLLSPKRMASFVECICATYYLDKKDLTILGGEHSVTIPALKSYAEYNSVKETTILHIDAHLDLRDKDEFREEPYGKFAHCCVMRRAWDFGFRRFVQVGARAYSKEERNFAQANGFKVFWNNSFCMSGVKEAIKTEKVWVSLDVDGINPAEMPATGTPVGGGPSFDDIRKLLNAIAREKKIVGVDVVEVAPKLGLTDLTAYNAAQLVYDLLCYRIMSKQK